MESTLDHIELLAGSMPCDDPTRPDIGNWMKHEIKKRLDKAKEEACQRVDLEILTQTKLASKAAATKATKLKEITVARWKLNCTICIQGIQY